jgi:phosphopantetheinyl transferase (holo-ACP synthase)
MAYGVHSLMTNDSGMIITADMLESLRLHLRTPDLQVLARPEWGSHNPEHRELIHKERDSILKNSPFNLHSSIAHTLGMGILVLSKHAVGVDAEVVNRAQDKVVARVSSPEDVAAAPNSASLWTAKEATFKALRPYNQPSVLSDISIGSWVNIDSQCETFRLNHPNKHQIPSEGVGLCIQILPFCFGFFVIHS